jgi:HSP20 family molecular chaperone IbpA
MRRFFERAFGMTRMQVFSSPLLLGFDTLEQMLDRATKAPADGYPPYNIERNADTKSEGIEYYRISLAVAGFAKAEIEITVEDRQLCIRGRQSEAQNRDYLHRGIAARQFNRSFLLADGMDVTSASLANGILAIDLCKLPPDRVIRKIEISE